MRTKPDRSNAIPPQPHAKLLAELEGFEHLLFEPMTQTDLDRLYALSERWTEQLGDSPEAIALCDALEDFIGAGIEDADVEKAYRELVECVQQTPSRVSHP
ncbi:hypothetical protein CKO42_09135 [Lamprobacter modestohalophilus]|uniref:Uncharacterized protein n=1 Tax=Lamprobacter modestohalophilus TaxID=1064514 RepID=A0A9X1B417_9GAMM|nr:hypothetical protein [Lamprobacter modestohalophilus]MBK1618599.1 hypothetical protein [Lamprobacter modestohalophilus]